MNKEPIEEEFKKIQILDEEVGRLAEWITQSHQTDRLSAILPVLQNCLQLVSNKIQTLQKQIPLAIKNFGKTNLPNQLRSVERSYVLIKNKCVGEMEKVQSILQNPQKHLGTTDVQSKMVDFRQNLADAWKKMQETQDTNSEAFHCEKAKLMSQQDDITQVRKEQIQLKKDLTQQLKQLARQVSGQSTAIEANRRALQNEIIKRHMADQATALPVEQESDELEIVIDFTQEEDADTTVVESPKDN